MVRTKIPTVSGKFPWSVEISHAPEKIPMLQKKFPQSGKMAQSGKIPNKIG